MSLEQELEKSEYLSLSKKLQDKLDERLDEAVDISVRAHKLSVKKEMERLQHLDMIQSRDIRIRMLEDSYQMVINSKWWKLTKPIRQIYEMVQKHVLHQKTMTEMLQEISDPARYDMIDYTIRPKDVYLASIREFAEGEKDAWTVLSKEYEEDALFDVVVSVVIPTFHAGKMIRELLASLKGQVGIKEVEIIVVDSGSTDDTIENCRLFGIEPIQIAQEEFSHSYARNLGAQKARGNYLLFMTQDALPTDRAWLYRMVSVLETKNVVALSPMEIPNGKGDLRYEADSRYFAKYLGLEQGDRIASYHPDADCYEQRKNAQLFDVSCLIRKDIFDQYGYAGDYAEDLRMGDTLLKDGYQIALLASVRVKHSHNRPAAYVLSRSFIDRKALCEIFPTMLNGCMQRTELLRQIKDGEALLKKAISDMSEAEEYFDNIIVYGRQLTHCIRRITDGLGMPAFVNLCNYIVTVLMPYVADHHAFINKELHDKILDAIEKAYYSEIGTFTADYCMVNGDDEELLKLLDLQKV